jgi:hypothetical protein
VRRLPILVLLTACLVPALAGAPRAELPPTAYEAMRAKASFVLLLRIQEVSLGAAKTDGRMRTAPITVRARVESVIRGSGLKPGDMVTLRYNHTRPLEPGWVGPAPVPILEPKTRVLAWLNRGRRDFAPAARGRSFEVLR